MKHNHFTRDVKPIGKCPACDAQRAARIAVSANPASRCDAQFGDRGCVFPTGHTTVHVDARGQMFSVYAEID